MITVKSFFVHFSRRSQKRKDNGRSRLSLPTVPHVDDGGYCVPVLSTSGATVSVLNPGYLRQNVTNANTRQTKGPGIVKVWMGRTRAACSLDVEKSTGSHQDSQCGSLKTGPATAGGQDSIYENIDGGMEDDESGIDAESFDSEYEDVESPDLATSRGHDYCNFHGADLGHGSGWNLPANRGHSSEHPDHEQIYHELETEYQNSNQETHVPDTIIQSEGTSNYTAEVHDPLPSGCASAGEWASACPTTPLPPEPDKGVASKLKLGVKDLGRMLVGWMPRREKHNPPVNCQIRMSELHVQPPAMLPRSSPEANASVNLPSPAACPLTALSNVDCLPASRSPLDRSPVAESSAAVCHDEWNRQRSPPYVSHPQEIGSASRDGNEIIPQENFGVPRDEDELTGIYQLATPVDMEQDEKNVSSMTASDVPSHSLPVPNGNDKFGRKERSRHESIENDAMCGEGDRSRQEPNANDAKYGQGDRSRQEPNGNDAKCGQRERFRHDYENRSPRRLAAQAQQAINDEKSAAATKSGNVRPGGPRDEEGYTLVTKNQRGGRTTYAPMQKSSTNHKPGVTHSVSSSTEDKFYNQISLEKCHVTSSSYDHLTLGCDVAAKQSSHVYYNVGGHLDQEEC